MNLEKELYEVHSEVSQSRSLNEGVRFFKSSKRLKKLSDKIGHSAIKKGGTKGYKEIEEYLKKLEEISGKFSSIETKFKQADSKEKKKEFKSDYKLLKKDFEDIVKILNKQTFATLRQAGFRLALLATPLIITYAHISIFEDFVGESLQRGGEAAARDAFEPGTFSAYQQARDTFDSQGGTGEHAERAREFGRELEAMSGSKALEQKAGIMNKVYDYGKQILTFTGVVSLFNFINKQLTSRSLETLTKKAIDDLKVKEGN
jgi:hypothetical protein